MSYAWMVIYPRGNYEILDVAQVMDYEQGEYRLASKKRFDREEEAVFYARKLSKEHNISLSENPTSDLLRILDLEENDEQSIY